MRIVRLATVVFAVIAAVMLIGCEGNVTQNNTPSAVDDNYVAIVNTVLNVLAANGVLANDSLAGNATITAPTLAVAVPTSAAGSVTLQADGSFVYNVPSAVFTGTDTFTYTLTGSGGSSTATVTIVVSLPPTGVPETYTTVINTPLTVPDGPGDLLDNDVLGDPVATLTSFGGGSLGGAVTDNAVGATATFGSGSLTVNADGSFDFTPDLNFTGAFTFEYRIANVGGNDDVLVTIGINEAPTATDDPNYFAVTASLLSVPSGTGLLLNDQLGFPLATVDSFGGGSLGGVVTDNSAGTTVPLGAGSLTVNADGSFDFTSDAGFTGSFTFEYRLLNTQGFDDATVTIAVQLAPVANPDSYSELINITINEVAPGVLGNDMGTPAPPVTHFGGGTLGGTVMDNTAGATVPVPGPSGTLTLNADGSLTFVPQTGFTGLVTFDYRIANTFGSDTATVTLSIEQSPTAVPNLTYVVGTGATLNVAAGAGPPDGLLVNDSLGFPLATITSFGGGDVGGTVVTHAFGTTVAPIPTFTNGSLTVNGDGSFSFTPPTAPTLFLGAFTFSYRLSNVRGFSDAQVSIDVRQIPIGSPDTFNVIGGTPLSVAAPGVLGNDVLGSPPGTLVNFGGGSLGGAVTDNVPGASVPLGGGTLTVNADGSLSLTAAAAPAAYTFLYRLQNASGFDDTIVTINVRELPVATNDGTYLASVGGTLSVPAGAGPPPGLLVNDTLGFPTATLTSFGGGSLGGAVTDNAAGASVGLAGGTLTVNADGSLTLANPTITGVVTFLYRLTNAAGTDDATVTIDVRLSPTANDDGPLNMLVSTTLSQGAPGLLVNDTLGAPPATLTSFGGGSLGGSVTDNAAGASVPLAGGTLQVQATGAFTLTNPTTTGTITFLYRITNVAGSDDATVTINVRQIPVANDDGTYTVSAGGTLTVPAGAGPPPGLLVNDTLGFPTATLTSFGGGSLGGAVTDNAAGASVGLAGGTLQVNADGSFTLTTPSAPGQVTFLYRLTNAAGTDDATVTIEVQSPPNAVNDPDGGLPATSAPSGVNAHPYHTALNTPLVIFDGPNDLLVNDGLGFPTATITSFGPSLANVTDHAPATSGFTAAGHTLVVNTDGGFTFSPAVGFTGIDTFAYRLTNGFGTSDATVTVAVGFRPEANADDYTAAHGNLIGNVSINTALATGFNVGTNDLGDQLTRNFVAATNGNAVLNANGTFTFDPAPGYEGAASFTYNVSNGFGTSGNATVSLNVAGMIWFVDNALGAAGDGRLSAPFNTLAGFVGSAADDPGDNIFIYTGTGPYTGGLTLLDNQRLLGRGMTVTLAAASGVTPPPDSVLPTTSGTNPLVVDGLTLGNSNTVRGLALDGTSTFAVTGSNFGTLVVAEVTVTSNSGGLSLSTGTVSGTFAQVSTLGGANALNLSGVDGTWTITGGTLAGSSGSTVTISGGAMDLTLGAAVNAGSATSPAVNVSGGTSTIAFNGNITQNNNQALLSVASHTTGTLTFSAALNATNGTGLRFDNADGVYDFTGATTLNGGDAGIDILNGSTGTFTFGAGTAITNPSGLGVFVLNSNGPVTYAGSVSKNSGSDMIHIEGRIVGAALIDFTGSLNANGSGGIRIQNNLAGTVRFSGASKVLNTGGNNALNLSTNTGPTAIEFVSGGLDIDTTSGLGISGSLAGTVTISGAGNTITTGSGLGMNVTNMSVGGGGITFDSVTSTSGRIAVLNGIGGDMTFGHVATTTTLVPLQLTNTGIVTIGSAGQPSTLTSPNSNVLVLNSCTLNVVGQGVDLVSIGGGTGIVSTGGTVAITTGTAGVRINTDGPGVDGTGVSCNSGVITLTGSANTVGSGTATAVDIRTTIGGAGITFRSINSSGGSTPGILLHNTGIGAFTVTGDGSTPGSGGTIQNKTGDFVEPTARLDSFNTVGTDGIYINNAASVSLSFVNVSNNNGNGVFGQAINGLTLSGVVIDGNADQAAPDECGLHLLDPSGTVNVSNCTVQESFEHDVKVFAFATTVAVNVNAGTTISNTGASTQAGDRLQVLDGVAANITLLVDLATFTGSNNPGMLTGSAVLASASGGTIDATLRRSTFQDNSTGISLEAFSGGSIQFDINDNSGGTGMITGNRNDAISLFTSGSHTGFLNGTIRNNTIGSTGVNMSGSQTGAGIRAMNQGSGEMTLLIDGNTIQQVGDSGPAFTGGEGINLLKSATAAGELNATIINNVIRDIHDNVGLVVTMNTASTLRASIDANTFTNIGNPTSLFLSQTAGAFDVTQFAPTPAMIAVELDDANGLTPADVAVIGTVTFGQAPPPLP